MEVGADKQERDAQHKPCRVSSRKTALPAKPVCWQEAGCRKIPPGLHCSLCHMLCTADRAICSALLTVCQAVLRCWFTKSMNTKHAPHHCKLPHLHTQASSLGCESADALTHHGGVEGCDPAG